MRILFKRKKHLIIIHKVYYTFISHVSITQIKEFILDLGKNFLKKTELLKKIL